MGAMELACPNCGARYRVADGAVPPEGRTITCAKCGESWHETGQVAERPIEVPLDPEPMGAGIPDVGSVDMGMMAYGPAAERADEFAADPPEVRRAGLGTVAWLLLIVLLGAAAAVGYALYTGQLSLS